MGCLLVGFCYAKAFAYARNVPWVGVDHLEGHLHSVFLSAEPSPLPLITLLASGGHTGIYYLARKESPLLMGQTRDDAAGEAYDKVSKLLGLGYPGGAAIELMAKQGDPDKINFPRPFLDKSQFDFSFSGLKTAVFRYVQAHPVLSHQDKADIAAAFQEAVIDVLIHKTVQAAKVKHCRNAAVVGGVAANGRLRDRLSREAANQGILIHIPPLSLCGDNAAMIAAAGYTRYKAGQRSCLDDDVYSRNPRKVS